MARWKLRHLAQKIRRGAVFAYPTDTIWGLGCHPLNAQSVRRLQAIKQRPAGKGLILLSAHLDYLTPYISPDAEALLHAAAHDDTDKPVTWLCPTNSSCPTYLTGRFNSIAVRITRHQPSQALSEHLRSPLISSSANISGRRPIRNSLQAHRIFQQKVDFIIDGYHSGNTQPSQIRDLQSGQIIRP